MSFSFTRPSPRLLLAALLGISATAVQATPYQMRVPLKGLLASVSSPSSATAGISLAGLVLELPLADSIPATLPGGYALTPRTAGSPTFTATSPFTTPTTSWSAPGTQGYHSQTGLLSGTGDFSMGLWLKTTATQPYLLQQRAPYITGEWVVYLSGGKACYWDFNGSGPNTVCAATSVNDNKWHLVGVVRQADSTLQLYVDGKSEYSAKQGGRVVNYASNTGLGFGYDALNNNSFFQGNMADIFLFSRVLSTTEWQQIYDRKAPLQ